MAKAARRGGTDPWGRPGPSGSPWSTRHSRCLRCSLALTSLWLPALAVAAPASAALAPPEGLVRWPPRCPGSRSWSPGSWSTWGCPWLFGKPRRAGKPYPRSPGRWSWGSSWAAWIGEWSVLWVYVIARKTYLRQPVSSDTKDTD